MAGWNENQLRKYNIKLEKIPTLQYDDPKLDSHLTNNVSACCNVMYNMSPSLVYENEKEKKNNEIY
jgi:hypothetical protein